MRIFDLLWIYSFLCGECHTPSRRTLGSGQCYPDGTVDVSTNRYLCSPSSYCSNQYAARDLGRMDLASCNLALDHQRCHLNGILHIMTAHDGQKSVTAAIPEAWQNVTDDPLAGRFNTIATRTVGFSPVEPAAALFQRVAAVVFTTNMSGHHLQLPALHKLPEIAGQTLGGMRMLLTLGVDSEHFEDVKSQHVLYHVSPGYLPLVSVQAAWQRRYEENWRELKR